MNRLCIWILFNILFQRCDSTDVPVPYPVPQPPSQTATHYTNPVWNASLADPTVLWDEESGYFYALGTETDWGDGTGTRLMPIVRSKDLVTWAAVGSALSQKPTWKSEGYLWAPDLNIVDGKYYVYYAYSVWGDADPRIGLAISNYPGGPYIDQGKLFQSQEIGVPNSIDPLFWEEDGKKYLFWGSFSSLSTQGTYVVDLSADGKSVSDMTQKTKIAAGDFEAVMIHKREGYYYFFGSKGSCCEGVNSTYNVRVARSTSLKGSYLDKDGKNITDRGTGTLILQGNSAYAGPGHVSRLLTDDAGDDWMLYHAINKKIEPGVDPSTRVLMLDKVVWKDGWPEMAEESPTNTEQKLPKFNKK